MSDRVKEIEKATLDVLDEYRRGKITRIEADIKLLGIGWTNQSRVDSMLRMAERGDSLASHFPEDGELLAAAKNAVDIIELHLSGNLHFQLAAFAEVMERLRAAIRAQEGKVGR